MSVRIHRSRTSRRNVHASSSQNRPRSCDPSESNLARYWRLTSWSVRVACLSLTISATQIVLAADETNSQQESEWSVESPPGPMRAQPIEATEGTWMTVSVSPDGSEVAFDFLGDLYVMPVSGADGTDGRRPEKLTSGMSWDMQPSFSHDGRWIAFVSDRNGKSKKAGWNVWILERATKQIRQVTNETFRLLHSPTWSPDDDYLVARKHFTSRRSMGAGELWMYHRDAIDSGAMQGVQLTKRPNDQKDVNEPAYSPDGKYLYYSQDVTPGETFEYSRDSTQGIYAVQRLELATGETERLISGPGGACRPVPSPDGKWVAFVRRVGARTGLHLFDVESGAVRLLYDQLERDMQESWAIHGVYSDFSWMPDSQSIVVWAKGKIRRIQIADGTQAVIPFSITDTRTIVESLRFPVSVAPEEFDVRMLRWVQISPDGQQVAYQALGKIYVRDLPDGAPRRLTDRSDEFEFCPSYSRDGSSIVYSTWDDEELGAIRVANVADGESRQVTTRAGHYVDPVVSPDGATIVFERTGGGYLRSPLYSHDKGIYAVPFEGGDAERISKSGYSPQFANDSDRVFLIRSEPDEDADNVTLYSIDLDGNERQEHYASQWATDFRISPDGNWVAFIERFNVYVAPFVRAGKAIDVGPEATGLPIRRISRDAGEWAHFSGDSKRMHWSLGPEFYTWEIANADSSPPSSSSNDGAPTVPDADSINIGFRARHARPAGGFALVGGRIVTMGAEGVIEDGTVVVEGNRIRAVGPRAETPIPDGVRVLDVEGQVVLPGFIDVHAHGPQATHGITPQQSWVDLARLAFGVTTVHDPSNDTQSIFAASEMTKAGLITAPRTFSTGRILYGAAGSFKAEVGGLDDARFHLRRMQAVGAFSVKSYNQPRRDQRQQIVAAARELGMMVVPEGGATFMNNMTMIVDGHTGIEHTLPVQTAYDDVMDLWRGTGVGYTPTLCVAFGGIWGEQYWLEIEDLWRHPRLRTFLPPHVLMPLTRRRNKAPLEDYNHIRVAEIARQVVDDGGLVQAGGHGQLAGICTHWEMWSFVQGGMTPMQALRCGTLSGAKYLGLDADLGSLEPGKLADLVVIEPDGDPTREIRDTQRIQHTIANGRIFLAADMTELDVESPRMPFYWEHAGYGMSLPLPSIPGCSCQLPGCRAWEADASDE